MTNDYDSIARVYDPLANLIFGTALTEAQKYLVNFIQANSRILIVGGGTGTILELIASIHSSGLYITYVEKSERMLDLSKQRDFKQNHVFFAHADICNFNTLNKFDIIYTAFLFDNFKEALAKAVFYKLDGALKPQGLWLYSDYVITVASSLKHRFLLKIMYAFFGFVCRVEASALPDMPVCFSLAQYGQVSAEAFLKVLFLRACIQKAL